MGADGASGEYVPKRTKAPGQVSRLTRSQREASPSLSQAVLQQQRKELLTKLEKAEQEGARNLARSSEAEQCSGVGLSLRGANSTGEGVIGRDIVPLFSVAWELG